MKTKLRAFILIGVWLVASVTGHSAADPAGETKRTNQEKTMLVTSKDGTKIAYDKLGKGPALVLVSGALATRADHSELAQLLATDFTVYNYDRRGRGDSGDTKPYSVEREIEDVEAIIREAGGSAHLYGISSGACLALQSTATLGSKVKKVAVYEAPYDESEGAAQKGSAFKTKLDQLLAANRRSDAVELFLKVASVPDEAIAGMKASPAWSRMEALAPTIAYDVAVVGMDGSVPVERLAKIKAEALVMDGGASAEALPFMRNSADKIAKAVPNAQRRTIDGEGHNVSSKVLAPVLVKFFSGRP
jgi:pimeloyl-ACP methyl ester carboxylesterase